MKRKILILLLLLTMISCVDTRDPETLTLELNPGVDTVEVNSKFTDAGATATLANNAYDVEVIENTVDISEVGQYQITYQTSFQDVVIEVTRYVDVVDETPPVLELNPGVDTINLNSEWEDAGITSSDNSRLDVTISQTGQVINSEIGEYKITYQATDANGNTSTIIRYVNVIDSNQ